jgi:hypothetical protein
MSNTLRVLCAAIAFAGTGTSTVGRAQEQKGPQTAQPFDISGVWEFHVRSDNKLTGNPVFTFKQEGTRLSGQYRGLFGEAPVEGKVEGSAVRFSFVGKSQGQQAVIAYSGAIERVAGKESMSGKIDFGGLMGGSWTANRRAAKKPRG